MKTKHKLMAYFLSFALILGMISTVNVSAAKKISLSNKKITITKGSSKTIKVKNTKKKVTWKVLSGKKCITLKKKGKTAATIKGKKKGTAKVQALVEKKKLVCTVTVDDKVISEQQNNPSATADINSPAQGSGKPTQTPDTTVPTEPPYQGEIITLHYNDDNADEIIEQIEDSKNPVHVIVDEGVTNIEDNAFSECSSLSSIDIPESVTSIGDSAFYGCSSLTSIEIPESVTSILEWAFQNCSNLTSIEIPGSVTSIGDGAFFGCDSLTSIKVTGNNQIYDSRNDCNAIIETETNTLIIGCKNTKIPKSVTNIGRYAFGGCSNLTNIEIPGSVTSIGEGAFYSCSSLTSIEIPESVTGIGEIAFYGCNSLTSIIWQDTTYGSVDKFIKAFQGV